MTIVDTYYIITLCNLLKKHVHCFVLMPLMQIIINYNLNHPPADVDNKFGMSTNYYKLIFSFMLRTAETGI